MCNSCTLVPHPLPTIRARGRSVLALTHKYSWAALRWYLLSKYMAVAFLKPLLSRLHPPPSDHGSSTGEEGGPGQWTAPVPAGAASEAAWETACEWVWSKLSVSWQPGRAHVGGGGCLLSWKWYGCIVLGARDTIKCIGRWKIISCWLHCIRNRISLPSCTTKQWHRQSLALTSKTFHFPYIELAKSQALALLWEIQRYK